MTTFSVVVLVQCASSKENAQGCNVFWKVSSGSALSQSKQRIWKEKLFLFCPEVVYNDLRTYRIV